MLDELAGNPALISVVTASGSATGGVSFSHEQKIRILNKKTTERELLGVFIRITKGK